MQDLRWPTYATRELLLDALVPSTLGGGSLRVRGADGRSYLDAVNGIGCAPLGHGHPLWIEAIVSQLTRLGSAANTYHTAPQQQLALRLAALFPVDDARVFFSNSGTEATEAAIKIVLRATGRDVIVVCERAFHGRTLGALSLTGSPKYREPYVHCLDEPPAERFCSAKVLRIPYNDVAAAEAVFSEHGRRIAAMFVEPVQGEAGVFPATRSFLIRLRELCNRHGALLGADEVQTGAGRTGSWTAWTTILPDLPEVRPDVLWMAKALGGGFPIGVCLARSELAAKMPKGSHGTTFGGNPLACAAALATLRILEEEHLLDHAGAQTPTLRKLADTRPIPRVTEIRGLGAMIGMQIDRPDDQSADPLADAMQTAGVMVTICAGHTVRLLFPYIAGEVELREVWTALAGVLARN